MERLPDHLPILDRPEARRVRDSVYTERELTRPIDLCDARGRLNPAAVGYARQPLFRANLSGHWPRKKRWNFWNWIAPDFVFSVTLADIDLTSFCAFTLTDFRDGTHWAGASYGRPGRIALPEQWDGPPASLLVGPPAEPDTTKAPPPPCGSGWRCTARAFSSELHRHAPSCPGKSSTGAARGHGAARGARVVRRAPHHSAWSGAAPKGSTRGEWSRCGFCGRTYCGSCCWCLR